ncbi:hypothetical protein BCR44DRAFT_1503429 [Catenaria anguillulae PL171]|uniref:Uncharacterized protein n=1 Tax=Catenaria anguillulae PL171 TaxID=765915 RepID=A0A1Y2HA77_9FUNG|nr:hypothetical protein BCR44DRAFT_1503429 [Catenaria anguillulae PL171]
MSTSTLLNDPRSWLLSGAHATLADALSALQPELAAAAQDLPSLNHTAFASLPALSGTLVTFTAMVQDTSLAPQITHCYGDRQPVYLVSVPDEASPVPADRVMPGAIKTKYPLPGVGHQACVAKYYPANTRLSDAPAAAAASRVGGSTESAAAIDLPALGSVVTVTGILEWNGNAQDDQDEQHNVPTIHSPDRDLDRVPRLGHGLPRCSRSATSLSLTQSTLSTLTFAPRAIHLMPTPTQ